MGACYRQENIVLEGAQGTFLDINFGTYPFVTSSATCASGICLGAGLAPKHIDHTIVVLKAYCTRVVQGPFPSEDSNVTPADHVAIREVGTTTGRKRRLGWFDAVMGRRAVELNGADSIALTKLDILDGLEEIKICVGYQLHGKILTTMPWDSRELAHVKPIYETIPGWRAPTCDIKSFDQLPAEAKNYLRRIEELCGASVNMVSVGPERSQTFFLSPLFANKETV
jgi:adenylosuccinate synthase